MKPRAIIAIAVMAAVVAVIISTYGDVSTSATFTEAKKHSDREFHITGDLLKEMPIHYAPEVDANYFTFFLRDANGDTMRVISQEPMVQDFEKTDKVSMQGYVKGEDFQAVKIMPKCPSKYEDQQAQAQVSQ